MFKSSITRFLITSLGVLMAGLLLMASILALQAWSQFSSAGRIGRLTRTDDALFRAVVNARAQVPKSSTALIAEDDPRTAIAAAHREASQSIAAALQALQVADIPNHAVLGDAIEAAWRRVDTLRLSVDELATRSRGDRSLHAIDDWRSAIHATTDALNDASASVGNAVFGADPLIDEMVQIRRTAWTIRDRYGLQCSALRANVDASARLTAAQLDQWSGNRAVYTSAWQTLEEFLLRPRVSPAMRKRIRRAHQETQSAQARVNAIVERFDDSGKSAFGGAEWTALCDGPFDAILGIAAQAQDEANQRATTIRAASLRKLIIAGLALTSVVLFGVFAVIKIEQRLAGPMRSLISTIARLSRREFDEPVHLTASADELGSMAQALETLRASALEAERLQLAMSRFTADASHQMRTPLTVLRTHISVLSAVITRDHVAYASLRDIEEASERLQRLLIQLLKLAHADSRQATAHEASTDLREIIQDVASKHVPQALEAAIDLHFEAELRPFPSEANPIMVNEIFANLIDNAIRYNNAGGSVVIRLWDEGGRLMVDVEDDGPGIPGIEHDKVFTRFYRMNRDQSRVGSGLGLAIVKSLAATLNATIHLSAGANDRGLRVRIAFT